MFQVAKVNASSTSDQRGEVINASASEGEFGTNPAPWDMQRGTWPEIERLCPEVVQKCLPCREISEAQHHEIFG